MLRRSGNKKRLLRKAILLTHFPLISHNETGISAVSFYHYMIYSNNEWYKRHFSTLNRVFNKMVIFGGTFMEKGMAAILYGLRG
jgi:hypothetical protein